jgi:hypothetical protein
MKEHLGTVFSFMDLETGERVGMWTNNCVTWFKKIEVPVLDEDLEETDEVEESDQAIAYEVFIKRFNPLDNNGIAFVNWALGQVAQGLDEKIGEISTYLASL